MSFDFSTMDKTWIFDLDGTLVEHNGYLKYGKDILLDGVREFFEKIPANDMVVILSARSSQYKDMTLEFLAENNIRFDHIIFDAPKGERILINDRKPDGLKCAYAVNLERNNFAGVDYICSDKGENSAK